MADETSLLIKSLPLLWQGTLVTLQLFLISISIGMCGGLCVGILNCRKMHLPVLTYILTGFVWMIRGTPSFVQVLIVYYALPEILGFSLSPFVAGVIALGINSTAYISEIVRGGINAIPDGQWEAAYVLGLNPFQTLRGIILPQMLRITLPSITNELTTMIKETSILMVIGVAELTKVSKDIVTRELDPITIYLATAVLYLLLTNSFTIGMTMLKRREE